MALQVELHPKAIAEARAERQWYEARSLLAAMAFVAEPDLAVRRIGDNPEGWPTYVHGTRRYLMRRFPFAVVYRRAGAMIEVVAVAHARRRPGYWRNR